MKQQTGRPMPPPWSSNAKVPASLPDMVDPKSMQTLVDRNVLPALHEAETLKVEDALTLGLFTASACKSHSCRRF